MKRRFLLVLLAIVVMAGAGSGMLFGKEIVVTSSDDSGDGTLRVADISLVIPEVLLPYESGERLFSDDIIPLLNGTCADENGDGIVAVRFSVDGFATLSIVVWPGYEAYLFDDGRIETVKEYLFSPVFGD